MGHHTLCKTTPVFILNLCHRQPSQYAVHEVPSQWWQLLLVSSASQFCLPMSVVTRSIRDSLQHLAYLGFAAGVLQHPLCGCVEIETSLMAAAFTCSVGLLYVFSLGRLVPSWLLEDWASTKQQLAQCHMAGKVSRWSSAKPYNGINREKDLDAGYGCWMLDAGISPTPTKRRAFQRNK